MAGILKQPDLDGVSDEVRKYIDSLVDGHDQMLDQLEKATKVIEELTDEDTSTEGDDDADDTDDDDGDDDADTSKDDAADKKKKEKKPVGKSDESDPLTDILKAHPEIASAIAKAKEAADKATKRAEEAEKVAKAERDRRVSQEFIAKAKTLDALAIEHDPVAKALMEMADKVSSENNEVIWKALHAANEQARSGALFDEIGSSARGGGKEGDAESSLKKAAKALMAQDATLTEADAITKAVAADPNLYHEYVEEQRVWKAGR